MVKQVEGKKFRRKPKEFSKRMRERGDMVMNLAVEKLYATSVQE